METLAKVGISMKEVTDKLTDDGVKLFAEAFDKLLGRSGKEHASVDDAPQDQPADLQTCRQSSGDSGAKRPSTTGGPTAKSRRLWQRDASLWTGTDEAKWLGWLDITEEQLAHMDDLQKVADDAKAGGFKRRPAARHGRIEPLSRSARE